MIKNLSHQKMAHFARKWWSDWQASEGEYRASANTHKKGKEA